MVCLGCFLWFVLGVVLVFYVVLWWLLSELFVT